MTRIAILDYGMGNLRSVEKALERAGATPQITYEHDEAREADGIVLPGVGAFPKAMERIRQLALDELITERVAAGTPLLGICLGYQLLFEASSELDWSKGLGILPGAVEPLQAPGLKVPHIGWSPVTWRKDSPLTEGLADEEPFYFVHSYAPVPANETDILASATYGEQFACAAARGSVFGVQFHPEKSSTAGLQLLSNFITVAKGAAVPA
jgi:glutamine amidotransferase